MLQRAELSVSASLDNAHGTRAQVPAEKLEVSVLSFEVSSSFQQMDAQQQSQWMAMEGDVNESREHEAIPECGGRRPRAS